MVGREGAQAGEEMVVGRGAQEREGAAVGRGAQAREGAEVGRVRPDGAAQNAIRREAIPDLVLTPVRAWIGDGTLSCPAVCLGLVYGG